MMRRQPPITPTRKVPRSIHKGARDMARQIASPWEGATSRRLRKKVEMLLAHLKRVLKLDRLRLRGPSANLVLKIALDFDEQRAAGQQGFDSVAVEVPSRVSSLAGRTSVLSGTEALATGRRVDGIGRRYQSKRK